VRDPTAHCQPAGHRKGNIEEGHGVKIDYQDEDFVFTPVLEPEMVG
jgi:hypothetical protein